jgi:serine O-acetyltransferase
MIILEDLKTQREGLLAFGFWALLIYRFGHARFVIKNKLLRAPWTVAFVILHKFSEMFFGIYLPSTAKIGRRFNIEHSGCIFLHGAATIGDDCMIRQGVTIGNDGLDDPLGAPTIGSRVQIGAGAKILGRIKIGNDVTIGANSVVLTDVPDNVVVFGVPARVFKRLDTKAPAG